MHAKTEYLLRYAMERDPAAVSDLITCMAAGQQLQVLRIPTAIMPVVVLLATVGLRTYNQQIIDNYGELLERMEQLFHDDSVPSSDYWHPSLFMVGLISQYGPRGEYWLDTHSEAGYVFAAYEQLVNADVSSLFPYDGARQRAEVPDAAATPAQPSGQDKKHRSARRSRATKA